MSLIVPAGCGENKARRLVSAWLRGVARAACDARPSKSARRHKRRQKAAERRA